MVSGSETQLGSGNKYKILIFNKLSAHLARVGAGNRVLIDLITVPICGPWSLAIERPVSLCHRSGR